MRRALGGLIIGAALVAGMTPAAMASIDLPGRPIAVVAAPFPAAGSCVAQDAAITVVDCASLHSAEISAAWTTVPADPPGSAYLRCEQAGERYLAGIDEQPGPAWGWTRPNVAFEVVRGPDSQPRPGLSWTACLVAPLTSGVAQDGGYRGRVSDQRVGRPPVAVRRCFELANRGRDDHGDQTSALVDQPCSTPHTAELLGVLAFSRTGNLGVAGTMASGVAYTSDSEPGRRAQCERLAQERTGAIDPTYSGRLSIVVRIRVIGETFGATVAPSASTAELAPMMVVAREYLALCDVEATGGEHLTRSVLDLGAAPLPLG